MEFPDGQLNENDEGGLQIATYIQNGRLIIDFGKEVKWLGFDKVALDNLIKGLQEQSSKLKE